MEAVDCLAAEGALGCRVVLRGAQAAGAAKAEVVLAAGHLRGRGGGAWRLCKGVSGGAGRAGFC